MRVHACVGACRWARARACVCRCVHAGAYTRVRVDARVTPRAQVRGRGACASPRAPVRASAPDARARRARARAVPWARACAGAPACPGSPLPPVGAPRPSLPWGGGGSAVRASSRLLPRKPSAPRAREPRGHTGAGWGGTVGGAGPPQAARALTRARLCGDVTAPWGRSRLCGDGRGSVGLATGPWGQSRIRGMATALPG